MKATISISKAKELFNKATQYSNEMYYHRDSFINGSQDAKELGINNAAMAMILADCTNDLTGSDNVVNILSATKNICLRVNTYSNQYFK